MKDKSLHFIILSLISIPILLSVTSHDLPVPHLRFMKKIAVPNDIISLKYKLLQIS